jgi:hypothetical protein
MNRRTFLSSSGLLVNSLLIDKVLANAIDLNKKNKSVVLIWLGGGASTIDLWDLKPGSPTAGEFKPIKTNVDGIEICEHLPLLSKNMHNLSIVRSMSTREADHSRARYYMHTGFVPNPNVDYPSYGSVISNRLIEFVPELDIPAFISINGASLGPGFLGSKYAPFVVDSNGRVKDMGAIVNNNIMKNRLSMLNTIENQFISSDRGSLSLEHKNIVEKTVKLLYSDDTKVFRIENETSQIKEKYGNHSFGKSCLMARRLVEIGVPFIEIDFGGWDNHSDIFSTLKNNKLPQLDQGMSALISDLEEKGLIQNTNIVCMGEFGRTPNINGNAGRDHWARSWSVVVGGGSLNNGQVIGQTNENGKEIIGEAYSSEDLMATIIKNLGISLETTFTSKNGRPIKIANSGRPIQKLCKNF